MHIFYCTWRMCPPEYILGAAVAASVAVFIFFGDKLGSNLELNLTHSGTPVSSAAGMMNLGQTCFFNAVLQALASCQSFSDWIAKGVNTPDVLPNATNSKYTHDVSQMSCSSNIQTLLHYIITELQGTGSGVVNSRVLAQLLEKIRESGWVVQNCEQHDAHELFHALMDLLHSEGTLQHAPVGIGCVVQESTPQALPAHKTTVVLKSNGETQHIQHPSSPMLGYIASNMRCKTCLHKGPTKYTEFSNLSLTFPPVSSHSIYKLEDLLKYYFLSDSLSDVDCENCSRVHGELVKSNFLREQSIGKVAQCLCLHIQRLGWYGHHEAIKRHDRVIFPSRLDVSEFTQLHRIMKNYTSAARLSSRTEEDSNKSLPALISAAQPMWYRLVAVIEHKGSENAGHFITYRRMNAQWMYTSDLDIKEVSAEHVHTRVPYMLFYEREVL